MKYYIYRNFTVENLLRGLDAEYSGYGDISVIPDEPNAYIWFYLPSINMTYLEMSQEIQDFQTRFEILFSKIPKSKTIIALTARSLFNFKGINSSFQLSKNITEYNNFLYELSLKRPTLKVLDFNEFYDSVNEEIFSWRFYYFSQSLINPKFNQKFIDWFRHKLNAIQNKRKKCLVLDLDNTLWGGILGEDGIEGIELGNTYPGIAYYDFQKGLLEAKNSGVILTLCSKNNLSDVVECWDKHPSILINESHLSAYKINWKDKPQNIREIAEELNIGLDSIVFIDDNPVERERVRFELPQISVPEYPSHPYMLPEFFKTVYQQYFQIHDLTKEDKNKTEQYKSNLERKGFRRKFTNLDEYFSSLEMQLDLYECNELNISRIAQMTQKTNQFNLTTKRYSEEQLRNISKNNGLIHCLSVKDRFGDSGITAASIVLVEKNTATIDLFLLSCRILGRRIESVYLMCLSNVLFEMGITKIDSKYIPTSKNKQTEEFYEKEGFIMVNEDRLGTKHFTMNLSATKKTSPIYKIKYYDKK